MTDDLLRVTDLRVHFVGDRTDVYAVEGVSFSIRPGEVLGLIGESGSGKTVTSLAITRLLPCPPAVVAGRVLFAGEDLLAAPRARMRELRGREIAMVFQDPLTSLNPILTVGRQLEEALEAHESVDAATRRSRAVELLQMVGIPDPGRRVNAYPHELSGGMRQRAMIAMAMALRPRLLIADEPTTALDVTVQAQILDLLRTIVADAGTAVLIITHDLGVVADLADRVAVMYAGRIVETASVAELFRSPAHPYSLGLLESADRLDWDMDRPIRAIPGSPPAMTSHVSSCPFGPRCPRRTDVCHVDPTLLPVVSGAAGTAGSDEHRVACHHPHAGADRALEPVGPFGSDRA